jgi:hypothetical protein
VVAFQIVTIQLLPGAVDELTVWGLWGSCSVRPMGKRA